MTPPAAGDVTETTASAVATLADASSPDVAVDTVDSATAAAASATGTDMDVDTDPSPPVVAPPTAEHISFFLLHIRRQAAGDAVSSSPDMAGGSADGVTATAASATGTGMDVDTDATPPTASADAHGSATKKRRRQGSRETTRAAQKHCKRMARFGAARGNTPTSDPGPVEGRPAKDSAEWRRG